MDPWYQRLWKSITSIFRIGEKDTFTPVNMIECMDGKPLSDKSIQDCLFNNQPTFPEKPIESMNGKPVFLQLPSEKRILFEHYWMSFNCTPENEESVKDSIDSAKEEPESVLETRKRNERFKCDNPEDTVWVS
ncbi:hypothetical protein TNCV_3138361 [Trichonephila clavipes]|nr:hypothetical protein TNCV_1754001 [Trichonephila clavipes]GFX57417.1 hypothetical protein TNCV_3138361 [Trichonephila clavipes]